MSLDLDLYETTSSTPRLNLRRERKVRHWWLRTTELAAGPSALRDQFTRNQRRLTHVPARKLAWETNMTHNLGKMFDRADVYRILWHGDGLIAGEQVAALEAALALMVQSPVIFEPLSAPNGWGTYKQAVPWLREVIQAFKAHPTATLRCST